MKLKRVAVASLALSLMATVRALAAQGQQQETAVFWLTTLNRSALFARQQDLRFSAIQNSFPAIRVDSKREFQMMDGLGFALTGGSAELLMHMTPNARSALLEELFSTHGDGIGVSYLRISIGSSDMNDHVFSYDDIPPGQTDPDLKNFSLGADLTTVIPVLSEILAIDPQIKILASPWPAPAWMKTNDSTKGGNLKPEYYGAYARYFVKYAQALNAAGIRLDTITVQNEPLNPKNNPSMAMFANEEDMFIKDDLGPAFRKARYPDENTSLRSQSRRALLRALNFARPSRQPVRRRYRVSSVWRRSHRAHFGPRCLPEQEPYLTEQSVTERPCSGGIHIAEPVSGVLIGSVRNWGQERDSVESCG